MITKNKQFDSHGIRFNVKVELSVSTERSPSGYHYHSIIINDMRQTNKYYKDDALRVQNGTPEDVEAGLIQSRIDKLMNDAVLSVSKTSSPIEDMFDELGFE